MKYVVNIKGSMGLQTDKQKTSKQLVDVNDFLNRRGAVVYSECLLRSLQNEIRVQLSDGSVKRAVLYIGDASNWPPYWRWPRLHIFYCKTLSNMQKSVHRYRASGNHTDLFIVDRNGHPNIRRLEICRKCLKAYNKSFKIKKTVHTFDIQEYFNQPMDN